MNYRFIIENETNLSRRLVKTVFCTVSFLDLELEIPPKIGIIIVERLLPKVLEDLSANQTYRQKSTPEKYNKIQSLLIGSQW